MKKAINKMDGTFLKDVNKKKVKTLPVDNEQFIRFWSEEEVQLDGCFTIEELQNIVSIMKSFEL